MYLEIQVITRYLFVNNMTHIQYVIKKKTYLTLHRLCLVHQKLRSQACLFSFVKYYCLRYLYYLIHNRLYNNQKKEIKFAVLFDKFFYTSIKDMSLIYGNSFGTIVFKHILSLFTLL